MHTPSEIVKDVLSTTKEALLIYEELTPEEFIKINKNMFEEFKEKKNCFCSFHNEFGSLALNGLKFNFDQLKEFYEYCVGVHVSCNDLKQAVVRLAKDEETESKFLAMFPLN